MMQIVKAIDKLHNILYFYDVGLDEWLLGIRTTEQVLTHP